MYGAQLYGQFVMVQVQTAHAPYATTVDTCTSVTRNCRPGRRTSSITSDHVTRFKSTDRRGDPDGLKYEFCSPFVSIFCDWAKEADRGHNKCSKHIVAF